MKRIIVVVVLILAIIFWQFFLQGYLLLSSVERFVGSFYEQYNSREFKYIYDVLSHQKMRTNLKPFQFQSMMEETYDKLGPVRGRKRVEWKRKRTKQGVFFFIEYRVEREKAKSLEKFVLARKNKDWFIFDYVVRVV